MAQKNTKYMKYEPIIGLEVHIELSTKSKMFCGCPADHFGKKPNTQTCPVCLGLPGALPVPNKKAIEWCILLGLALHCDILPESKFDRKHYFYPDLPKGYQISQYDKPFAINGSLELSNNPIIQSSNNPMKKKIRIRRVHMEEDTGKLIHSIIDGKKVSLVDFNRSGVPLVEIVTEPDFRSVDEVDQYVKKLQQIVRYLGISGADMEKGSMRIEPSISILPIPPSGTNTTNKPISKYPNYRVELKNINSFRFVRKALEYEIKRQAELLESGEMPVQQTRGWDEGKGETVPQREKEEAHDYRYFPEPDIPPMRWESSQLSAIRRQIPELPDEKKERFVKTYELSEYDATLLTTTKNLADFFEEAVKVAKSTLDTGNQHIKQDQMSPKKIANWMINKQPDIENIVPAQLVSDIVKATEVVAVDMGELEATISRVISANEKAVADYRAGKEQAIMFLFGMINKELKGKGEKSEVLRLLKEKLTGSAT